jgi:hypothetical protein
LQSGTIVVLTCLQKTWAGRSIRREPTLLQVTDQAREILHHLGWTKYFNRLQGYDINITLAFFQNLQRGVSVIRDIQIPVTEEIIVEVTGLPNEGTQWTGKYTTLKEVVESFAEPGEELDKKGKGLNPTALSEPWRELAGVIQRYITCDGRYDVVRPCHLKLLAALKQRSVINFPFFLNAMLHEVAARTQKAKDPVNIISHHGLVKLIVNRALSQTQITWGDLIEPDRPLQIEQPEIHHEIPPQGIEAAQVGGDSAQIEIPVPQPEMEADPIQLAETQTIQAETSKKKRQRTILFLKPLL